jgi:hypothetical protein
MSLREHERRRRQRQQSRADDLPVLPDDNLVMTFAEWCQAASIGQRTGRRILKAPGGPVVTQLGPRNAPQS